MSTRRIQVDLDFAMLARSVYVSEGEFFIHAGGFSQFVLPSLPAAVQIGMAVRWKAVEAEIGDSHKAQVRIYGPDGDEPIANTPLIEFTLTPDATVPAASPADEGTLDVVFGINLGVSLASEGSHRLLLLLDGEEVRELRFRARLGRALPEPAE
jgi:hypothetical protein